MLFKCLFIVAVVLELLCLSCYLFAGFCQKGKRPLIAKCVCSGLFILIGVFAMLAASNYTAYAVFMLVGLFFSFWGDYFLGISMKGKYFIAGMASFLIAHVFYIFAYFNAIALIIPGEIFFNTVEIIAIAVLLSVLAIASLKLKLDMGVYKIPVYIYSVVIVTMLVKAFSLSIRIFSAGAKNALAISALIAGGALLFVISDAVLSLILFAGKDKRPMTVLNLITYFSAQILLASSIFFMA